MENEIETLRKRLGKSRPELAAALGVNLTTIWRWETGKMPVSGPAIAALRLMADNMKQVHNE